MLWDIDGTLLHAGGAGSAAFVTALKAVTGRDPGDHQVRMSGKTDRLIASELLAVVGLAHDADALLPPLLDALAEALAADQETIARHGHVFPGIRAAVAALAADTATVQTLLTGNIARNARTKLAAFGLEEALRLPLGAYGDDHLDRDVLVPVAWERVAAATGVRHAPERTWVVGDTPRDLSCARAVGARCVLVGTGVYPTDELRALDADAVFDDLADTAAFLASLG